MAIITLSIKDIESNIKGADGQPKKSDVDMVIGDQTNVSGQVPFDVEWENIQIIQPEKKGGKPTYKKAKGKGELTFSLILQRISFSKQMYSPNSIKVLMQIDPGKNAEGGKYYADIPRTDLLLAFKNKRVELKIRDPKMTGNTPEVVGNDFFIQELVPVYKKDAMYVTFHMFSPDKVMTYSSDSRTFVAKKLKAQILKDMIPTFEKPYPVIGTSADGTDYSKLSFNADNMKMLLSDSKEHIFPYLVQYNESFYDFLARTANRWGEFMYWENGTLNFGYKNDVTEVEDFDSYTYLNMSSDEQSISNFNLEAGYDDNILKRPTKKEGHHFIKGQMPLYNSDGWDIYIIKKVSNLLSYDKQIIDWIVSELIDDTITYGQVKKTFDDVNEKFDKILFANPTSATNPERYNGGKNELNPFSEYDSLVNNVKYLTCLKGEVSASQNMIQFNLDTGWKSLKLGQVIKFKGVEYIITSIVGTQLDTYSIEDNRSLIVDGDYSKKPVKVIITAIQKHEDDNRFYPTVIPAGHVRQAQNQVATVQDVDDPIRANRVRVKFDWQNAKYNEDASPWLKTASTTATEKAGIQAHHYKDDKVLVSFVEGNIERPVVIGSVPKSMVGAMNTNDLVFNTPNGQSIKMTDGTGAGATAMLAGISPTTKIVQGFFPAYDLFSSSNSNDVFKSCSFEGGIEMGDKYGLWSIKGSTDGRNVSIRSAWGDVKINAWTGITISAPNGDVTIKGKNIKLEAGNNITFESGKNVKNKWYPTLVDTSNWLTTIASIPAVVAEAVGKKLTELAVSTIDLAVIRTLIETFVKPVEGKLEVKSNRFLMLEAGGGSAAYPVEAYRKGWRIKENVDHVATKDAFESVHQFARALFGDFSSYYAMAKMSYENLKGMITHYTMIDLNNANNNVLPCKKAEDILAAAWNGTNIDDAFMNFSGFLKEPAEGQDDCHKIIKFYWPAHDPENELDMAYLQNTINDVKAKQTTAKANFIAVAKEMAASITMLKSMGYFAEEKARIIKNSKLINKLTIDMLSSSMLKKKLDDDNFKKLVPAANEFVNNPEEEKKLRRKFFIEAISALDIKLEGPYDKITGLRKSAPAAPDPYADDPNIDTKWQEYCDCVRTLTVTKDKEKETAWDKFLTQTFVTPAKQSGGTAWYNFGKNMADHFAFAGGEKGKILFSTEPGTMVLGPEIYRANVDYSEDVKYSDDEAGKKSGNAAQIRRLMKQ